MAFLTKAGPRNRSNATCLHAQARSKTQLHTMSAARHQAAPVIPSKPGPIIPPGEIELQMVPAILVPIPLVDPLLQLSTHDIPRTSQAKYLTGLPSAFNLQLIGESVQFGLWGRLRGSFQCNTSDRPTQKMSVFDVGLERFQSVLHGLYERIRSIQGRLIWEIPENGKTRTGTHPPSQD